MPEPPTTRPVVAAFDVDGTLTRADCVDPFLRRAAGWRLPLALARHPVALAGALARRDRDRAQRARLLRARGIDGAALDRLGAEFARDFVAPRLRETRPHGSRVTASSVTP